MALSARGAVLRGAAAALLPAVPGVASAHGSPLGVGAFYSGLLHPLISPAQLIGLLALGLLFGQQGLLRSTRALLALASGLAVGGIGAAPPPGSEELLAGLQLAAGLLAALAVVAARPLPRRVLPLLALALGLVVGLDAASGPWSGTARAAALGGSWGGALLCTACVAAAAQRAARPWQRTGLRVGGSWLAASAMLTLAVALARP